MKISLAAAILASLCVAICATLHAEKRQEQSAAIQETSETISSSLYGTTLTSLDSSVYASSQPSTTASMSLTSIHEDEAGGGGGDKSISIAGAAGESTTATAGTIKQEDPDVSTIRDSTDTAIPSVSPSSFPTSSSSADPAPYPDYTSASCEPCSKMYRDRIYTLNNGIYCGECDIDGVRSHVNPQNGCATTREGDIDMPKDGRPVACVGTPGATPGSRACLSTCNAFVSLSRSTSPCRENTYNAGHACRMCVENGDGVVVLADAAGGIDNIRGIEFGILLGSLSTWCAAHPRCTDLQTGLVTAGNPACGTLRYGHQGGSSDHDGETTTGRGEPSTTRPSTSRGGNKPPSSNNQGLPSSASFRGSETTLRTDVSSNSPTESGIPDSLASSFVTQQSSPAKAPFSYLNITSFSTTTRTNEIGEPVTSTYTARINVLLNDNGSVITTLAQTLLPSTEVIEATSPSKSITDERAFADATPSSPFTSGTRRRMSLQPFNMRAGVLWLAWLITMLGRSR